MIMSALMSTSKEACKGSASGHLCTGDVRIGELMPKGATPLSWDVVLGLRIIGTPEPRGFVFDTTPGFSTAGEASTGWWA
jgi:hypothetical protein